MKRGLLLVVLAVLFAVPAQAVAVAPSTDRPLTTTRVMDSLAIAAGFWGRAPACDVRVFAASPAEMFAASGVASAGITYLGGLDGECPVWVSDIYAAASIENRIDACDTIVHEWGHALGLGHDENPLSVMNPDAEVAVWGCYRRFIGRGGRVWRESHSGSRWAVRP